MPLPQTGPWPPPGYVEALTQIDVWDAWYVGEADQLATIYGGGSPIAARASQRAGGVVGFAARMFWGKPEKGTQTNRSKVHMPVAADLCRMSAQLLFAEPPTFTSSDPATQTRLDDILNTPTVHSSLIEAAEKAAALSGSYLRLVWDTDIAQHVMVDVVDVDRGIPEFKWGRLTAVTFWTRLAPLPGQSDGVVHWHLERHESGNIFHGLYEGKADRLGRPVPLTEHPSTDGYAAVVNADSAIPTGTTRLTAAYVPNMRPNRAWRKKAYLSNLGRSDLAGVEPLMDFIDETWSSLARDLRIGKGRIIVPDFMLESGGRGQGASFDYDTEVFVGMKVPPTAAVDIKAQQFDIRVDDHLATINAALREVLRLAGYSPITFGLTDEVAATATEIHAREKDSLETRATKIRHWTGELVPFAQTLLEVDAMVFPATAAPVKDDTTLVWPDGAHESLLVRAQSVQALQVAQAASTETRVKIMQPNLGQDEVDTEVGLIRGENSLEVPDLGQMTGEDPASTQMDPAAVKSAADAMGVLIRSGVEPVDAAERVGLTGVTFTGAVPTSLRLPEADASGLEQP